jgi:hypothetical protein
MLKNTELQEAAYGWIKALPHGRFFETSEIYRFLEEHFAMECSQRGDAATEPRYKNDARWAVQLAKRNKLLKITNIRGRFQRQ